MVKRMMLTTVRITSDVAWVRGVATRMRHVDSMAV
jgi:hypothetical protein